MLNVANKPYTESIIMLFIVMLNDVILNVANKPYTLSVMMLYIVMLNDTNKPFMLSVVMLNIVMLRVVVLSFLHAELRHKFFYAKYRYAECRE